MSKTKVTLSAEQSAEKWQRRTSAAIPDIQRGIAAVTVAPTQQAAQKLDKALTNYTAAIQSGKTKRALEAVTLEEWRTKTSQKVAERLPGGVAAAKDKRMRFDAHNIAALNEILPQIAAMPDLTLEDSVNRVRALMEGMRKRAYKK